MSIFRTTDPTQFDDVDGIIIDESAPAPNIIGVSANTAILVGQFQRGRVDLWEPGSIGEFLEEHGKSSYSGNIALKNKQFGRLRVIRAVAAAAATATKTFTDGAGSPADIITFTAKQGPGLYGNNITVKIEAGSSSGKKYTIVDGNTNAVLPTEVYDNVVITTAGALLPFANSKLINVTIVATTAEPANASATALASGTDGSIADTDYQTAIAKAEVENAGNFLFLDSYNDTRNGYLELHAAATQDKMVVMAGAEGDSVSTAITDVADYRDTDGRIIYAYPWLETVIDGVKTMTSPASWLVSIMSNTSPHIDPAFKENTKYLAGVTNLKRQLTRTNYISLKEAGIAAFEYDADIGFSLKSGIVTQIANSSKLTILRRRMADWLTNSVGRFLKNYQNAPNTKENRTSVKAAISAFVAQGESDGILPKDSEVQTGKAKLIDTESLNTDASIAAGFFKCLYKQRIYSSMRYIVLQAEIGESVVVTEQAS